MLSAHYQIETHLKKHYSNNNDDIVYGFNLSLAGSIKELKTRPKINASGARMSKELKGSMQDEILEQICLLMPEYNAKRYLNKLNNKLKDGEISSIGFTKNFGITALVEPKTNHTVRIHIFSKSFNSKLIKKLITNSELEVSIKFHAQKYFIAIDILDFELLHSALELGYKPEGVLKNYYYVGNDMMIVSKF